MKKIDNEVPIEDDMVLIVYVNRFFQIDFIQIYSFYLFGPLVPIEFKICELLKSKFPF